MDNIRNMLLAAVHLLSSAPTSAISHLYCDVIFGTASDSERVVLLQTSGDQNEGPPHPDQGGQRITEEWLDSLSNQDCFWRFRMTAPEIYTWLRLLKF